MVSRVDLMTKEEFVQERLAEFRRINTEYQNIPDDDPVLRTLVVVAEAEYRSLVHMARLPEFLLKPTNEYIKSAKIN